MAVILDNHAAGTQVTATSNSCTLSCSAGALILVYLWTNGGPAAVTSITDSSGQSLTYTLFSDTGGTFDASVWWTRCVGAFSGVVITANYGGSTPSTVAAFAVTGQSTSTSTSWQDGTAAVNGGAGSTVGTINYTTINANTMVVNVSRWGSTISAVASAPWTLIDGAGSLAAEYQSPVAPGTYTSAYTTSDENANVSFAIVPASAAATGNTPASKRIIPYWSEW